MAGFAARCMSAVWMGLYTANWRTGSISFRRQPDGSLKTSLPGNPDAPVPIVVAHKDAGSFVHALERSPPGLTLLGYGQMLSWNEYMALWARITCVEKATYKEASAKTLTRAC